MKKLNYHTGKTLKLTNVLKNKILLSDENFNLNTTVEQMQSYIRTHGARQIGPLIQYSRTFVNDNQELDMEIFFLLQCDNFIHGVEYPYQMESVIRVPDAMYCRYMGPEQSLKIAYDKIHVEAFEQETELAEESYTVFVESNEEEGTIVADVFVPRKG